MAQGWIKLYRDLRGKPIWKCSNSVQRNIIICLLLMANHEESEWEWLGKKFKVMPGQMITSLESITKEAGKGVTVQNVRTALVKFEKLGFLTNISTKTGRLITLVNWELYQSQEINQQSIKQRPNKDLTTNKNNRIIDNIYIHHFDTFWDAYPKKIGKPAAEKIFNKLKVDDELLKNMLMAIEKQKQSKQWQEKQFIPNPSTWLNQERWLDEVEEMGRTVITTNDGTFKF